MDWYARNQEKSEYRRKRWELLTEEKREEMRARKREIYAQQIKDGWQKPYRKRSSDVVEYRTLLCALLVQRDHGLCGICGKPVESGQESPDHIIPKCLGGTDAAENIRLSHRTCNTRRPRKPAAMRIAFEEQVRKEKEALH